MRKNVLKKSNKGTNQQILNRRIELRKIIDHAKKKGIFITRQYLLDQLKKKGFVLDKATLYRDRTFLNQNNTFIRDIAESNYSEMMQDIWEKLEWVEEQAEEQYQKKWTNSRMEKFVEVAEAKIALEEGRAPEGVLVKAITTGEIANPKGVFLNIIKDVQKQKFEFLTGHNIHLSAAMLQRKLVLFKDRITELEHKETIIELPTE